MLDDSEFAYGAGPLDDRDPTAVRDPGEADTNVSGTTAENELTVWRPGRRVHGFRLEKVIGRGATGIVYRAVEESTGSRYALKVLRRSNPRELARLKRGFRSLVDVFHPNLVTLHRLFQLEGRCFITMEEVDGQPLLAAIHGEGITDPAVFDQRIYQLVRQAGSALLALHARRLVHRDIKPSNLLIDRHQQLRLIDYGLVGSYDPESDPDAHRSYVAGTREYMAPEVLSRQIYPPGSDIFSLGRVIIKLISTVRPRPGEPEPADAAGWPGPAVLPDDLPDDLRQLCEQMTATDIGERPTAWELACFGGSEDEVMPTSWLAGAPPQIVGRAEQLMVVRRWLQKMVRGEARRLHITGASGIGKSRFLEAAAELLEAGRWVQLFQSRCRPREDIPMRAFDEMIDTLAKRYGGNDGPHLELDPVSREVLRSAFPVISTLLDQAGGVRRDRNLGRAEAQDAAMRLTEQVCRHGPVVIMVDDVQWADSDSLNLLRQLQSGVQGMLGIITASRDDFVPTDVAADEVLRLDPLPQSDAIDLLRARLRRRQIQLPDEDVRRLAEWAHGNAHCLVQLTACVASAAPQQLQQWIRGKRIDVGLLWSYRYKRLSESARTVLTSLVAAGGPVEMSELAIVTDLGEPTRVAVSELRQEQLVRDYGDEVERVEVYHDSITDAVAGSVPVDVLQEAHRRWGRRLIEDRGSGASAALVAGHLLKAGEIVEGMPYALRAAAEAEGRFAYGEAGRWHERVTPLLGGMAALTHLRRAAECYEIAGRAADAARMYDTLAKEDDQAAAPHWRGLAAGNYIRGGQMRSALGTIASLAQHLQLPAPTGPSRSRLRVLKNLIWLRWRLRRGFPLVDGPPPLSQHFDDRLRVCLGLTRALSMYDNLYAAELMTQGMLELVRCGSTAQRLQGGVAYAVFGSYDCGRWRRRSAALLSEINTVAEQLDDPDSLALVRSGTSYHAWLEGKFAASLPPAQEAVSLYRNQCRGRIFEAVHVSWPMLWSHFFLGQLKELSELADQMVRDAQERDDYLARQVTAAGFGGTAWLMRDDVAGLKATQREARASYRGVGPQMFHFLLMFGVAVRKAYVGKPELVIRTLDAYQPAFRRAGFGRLQLGRVLWSWLRANAALQLAQQRPQQRQRWLDIGSAACDQLRREPLPLAQTMAALCEGRAAEFRAANAAAVAAYSQAAETALQQQLRPFQLAALDRLDLLHEATQDSPPRPGSRLHDLMQQSGVARPEHFLRLYTVP